PDRDLLESLAAQPTVDILGRIGQVMRGLIPGDTSLVDLYLNKGAADPGLIAHALLRIAAQDGQLFPDDWTIVTLDVGVLKIADIHDLPTMGPSALAG